MEESRAESGDPGARDVVIVRRRDRVRRLLTWLAHRAAGRSSLVVLVFVWIERRSIASGVIDNELDKRGVQATYNARPGRPAHAADQQSGARRPAQPRPHRQARADPDADQVERQHRRLPDRRPRRPPARRGQSRRAGQLGRARQIAAARQERQAVHSARRRGRHRRHQHLAAHAVGPARLRARRIGQPDRRLQRQICGGRCRGSITGRCAAQDVRSAGG